MVESFFSFLYFFCLFLYQHMVLHHTRGQPTLGPTEFAVGWEEARFKARTAASQSGVLVLSHFSSKSKNHFSSLFRFQNYLQCLWMDQQCKTSGGTIFCSGGVGVLWDTFSHIRR
jgi:hypothetical protein